MPITFHCPACRHRLKVPDGSAGKRGKCPNCSTRLSIPFASDDSASVPTLLASTNAGSPPKAAAAPINPGIHDPDLDAAAPIDLGVQDPDLDALASISTAAAAAPTHSPRAQPPQFPMRVVVVDFDMPFGSMVGFMVKWALAAIPAFLILFCLGMGLTIGVGIIGWLLSQR
jgi:hypothetical protein